MVKPAALILALVCPLAPAAAAAAERDVHIGAGAQALYGSLLVPDRVQARAAVLMLAGSGPDDRNGDELKLGVRAHTLQLLAQGFAEPVRGAKRTFADSRAFGPSSGRSQRRLRVESSHGR